MTADFNFLKNNYFLNNSDSFMGLILYKQTLPKVPTKF